MLLCVYSYNFCKCHIDSTRIVLIKLNNELTETYKVYKLSNNTSTLYVYFRFGIE